jgi:hypothetical protein
MRNPRVATVLRRETEHVPYARIRTLGKDSCRSECYTYICYRDGRYVNA